MGILLLLTLTILAMSGLATAVLELKMAGNAQYQERAFQAAEYAIEQALASPDLGTAYTYSNPKVVPASGANGHRSAIIGVSLVLVAVAMMLVGAVQHLRFLRTLGPAERPPFYSSLPAIAASAVLGVIGVLLAVSLLIWSY